MADCRESLIYGLSKSAILSDSEWSNADVKGTQIMLTCFWNLIDDCNFDLWLIFF